MTSHLLACGRDIETGLKRNRTRCMNVQPSRKSQEQGRRSQEPVVVPATNKGTRKLLPKDFKPIFYQPKQLILQDEREHRYFQLFSDKMAPHLAGYFESDLWSRLVLQACERDMSIRHAIIALAALKSTSEVVACLGDNQAIRHIDAQTHHHFALEQYSKAIQSMQKAALDGKQDLRTTLITCIVIICFETYSGNYESATRQTIIGLDLIEARTEAEQGNRLKPPSVEEELYNAFARLDIQAMSFIDPRPPARHLILKDVGREQVIAMPEQFSNWKEARMYLSLVGGRMLHFIASILPDNRSKGCLTFDVSIPLPSEFEDERSMHVQELDRWTNSFRHLKDSITTETDEDFLAAAGLELQCITCNFSSAVIRSEGQQYADTKSLMPHFEKMVSLSEAMLTHPRVLAEKTMYAFEMQVICPLYAVAWRCPQRTLRRKAIKLLLDYPRKEALWDSVVVGKLAEWIMGLEEEGLKDEYVPEERRCTGVDIVNFNMLARMAQVRCLVSEKESGAWIRKETVITW
ncbi:uncharacterized protein PAC_09117 [Phialocephala subalpina]|uniref:Uncharacterized protein n=1 Tax=Phialocephala subalpina TaxID=576137 RepID=A0A1L7X2H8_9HELO|nr:uncharacterized protein PAC_09117 [Phialocephala subalpina]